MFKQLAVVLLTASSAVAFSISGRSLPSGTVTCGSNKYSSSQLTAAINAGLKDMSSGNLPGTLFDRVMSFRG